MATISVALCTHNGASYIEEQLASILQQTVPATEIVLSDDASTDDTVARARTMLAGYPDGPQLVVLTNSPALGVTANFESALRACTGDLIALSDQDDVWYPDRLERAAAAFEEEPSMELLFADARLVDAAGDPLGDTLFAALGISTEDLASFSSGAGFELLLRRNLATGATMTIARSLLARALPIPGEWVHDEWLAVLAASTDSARVSTAAVIDYRQHGANQIGVRRASLATKVRKVLGKREERGLAGRSRILAERLRSQGNNLTDLAEAKAAFEGERERLPRGRFQRLGAVAALDRNGLYERFASQGRLDVMRDLLQSHRG